MIFESFVTTSEMLKTYRIVCFLNQGLTSCLYNTYLSWAQPGWGGLGLSATSKPGM